MALKGSLYRVALFFALTSRNFLRNYMQLTEEQQQIIQHSQGHALVSAVAGSGKTTTMVEHIRVLLERGCMPKELMVLMFNRSARDGFVRKLAGVLASTGYGMPEIRTFHSLGLRLVESFTRKGTLPRRRLVSDDGLKEKLAKQALNHAYKEEKGNHAWASKDDLEEFLRFIELVKADIVSPGECYEQQGLSKKYQYFLQAYDFFEEGRLKQNIRFFDDLLHEPVMALKENPQLAEWVANRVDHIIVDEYQDINEVQQQLLKFIGGSRARVMAVGDVDQCIYEWRGARPEYITSRFQYDFPAPRRYTLSYTFRFGHNLSLAANHLIGHNLKRDRKFCVSHTSNHDTRLGLYNQQERQGLADLLGLWQGKGRSLREAVVLVRLYGMSVPVELSLLEAGIPYRLEGHEPVFECREVQALTGYLMLCTRTLIAEEQATRIELLVAMLSQPHLGIRQEELERLAAKIAVDPEEGGEQILLMLSADMPGFVKKKILQAADDWQWLLRRKVEKRADLLLREIVEYLDLYEFYHKFSSRQVVAESRIETCRAFIDFAQGLKLSAEDFLAHLQELQRQNISGEDVLLITSIHRAKGLEWPLVVVPGLEDGVFPFISRAGEGSGDSLEDERRLFYVAITRGIEQVALFHPPDLSLSANIESGGSSAPKDRFVASRFLFESNMGLSEKLGDRLYNPDSIEPDKPLEAADITVAENYLQTVGVDSIALKQKFVPKRIRDRETELPSPHAHMKPGHTLRISDLKVGLTVVHKMFGAGKIQKILDRSQGRIVVDFTEHRGVTLIVSRAPLSLPN